MFSPFRTFAYMTAFFAAGAAVIMFARGPQGLPAIQAKWQELRQMRIDNLEKEQGSGADGRGSATAPRSG